MSEVIENESVNDPLPKPIAGRPRLARNYKGKYAKPLITKPKFNYTKQTMVLLNVPKIPLVWRARKQLWLLKMIELHLNKDPSYISPKEYFSLLDTMEKTYTDLEKAGLGSNEKRREFRKRVQQKRMGETGESVSSSRVGETESPVVGNGVSAPNPFGKQG